MKKKTTFDLCNTGSAKSKVFWYSSNSSQSIRVSTVFLTTRRVWSIIWCVAKQLKKKHFDIYCSLEHKGCLVCYLIWPISVQWTLANSYYFLSLPKISTPKYQLLIIDDSSYSRRVAKISNHFSVILLVIASIASNVFLLFLFYCVSFFLLAFRWKFMLVLKKKFVTCCHTQNAPYDLIFDWIKIVQSLQVSQCYYQNSTMSLVCAQWEL